MEGANGWKSAVGWVYDFASYANVISGVDYGLTERKKLEWMDKMSVGNYTSCCQRKFRSCKSKCGYRENIDSTEGLRVLIPIPTSQK